VEIFFEEVILVGIFEDKQEDGKITLRWILRR